MHHGLKEIIDTLSPKQQTILLAVKEHAEKLLNHSPRFKFFTLHGTEHLNNLFDILSIMLKGGVKLSQNDLFLLSLAICIHDLGMVVSLSDKMGIEILEGRPNATDPAALEDFIRNTHHELIDAYYQHNLEFLLNLGLDPAQLSQVRDISRCHRKVVLHEQKGLVQSLGALLRIIDELDLGSNRAPIAVLRNQDMDMDTTSCWHWFKHNIVEGWTVQHTVNFVTENGHTKIVFVIAVHPSKESSVPYWLTQIRRPIFKAIDDDGAGAIVRERYSVDIQIAMNRSMSNANNLGEWWAALENKALSSGRKVILVIDDEFRKLEDLFLPLQDTYHVEQAHNARDALTKLDSRVVDLVIVDMQIGSGGIWGAHETEDYKLTGLKLCQEISQKYPGTKIGILTGTKHPIPNFENIKPQFFLRKPVDPDTLTKHVRASLP